MITLGVLIPSASQAPAGPLFITGFPGCFAQILVSRGALGSLSATFLRRREGRPLAMSMAGLKVDLAIMLETTRKTMKHRIKMMVRLFNGTLSSLKLASYDFDKPLVASIYTRGCI